MKNKKTYMIISAAVCAVLLILGAVYFITRKTDADENAVTRFEWMEMLGEQFGINEYTTESPYFRDVDSANPYFAYVQAAAEWEMIDTDSDFDGEDYVVGQFAALTAMKAIGESKFHIYFDTDEPITEDTYIEFATGHGLIEEEQLSKGLSREECEQILEIAGNLSFGELWKDDYSNVVYQNDVIELSPADILQSNEDGSVIVVAGELAASFEVGTILVFEQEDTKLKLAREITDIDSDGTLSLRPAELDQVVESLTVSDITEVTFEDIVNYYGLDENTGAANTLMYRKTDADLVNTVVLPYDVTSKGYKLSVSTEGEGDKRHLEIKITDHTTGVSYTLPISEKVDPDSGYSVEIDIDKICIGGQVRYSVWNRLEYAKAAVDAHATFKGSIETDEDKKILLFKTPVPLGNAIVGVDIQIYLVLSVEGGISFEVELPIEASVSYEKYKGLRNYKHNISAENPMVEVNCEAGAMLRIEPTLIVLGCLNAMDAEADIGVKASAKTTARSNSQICADISVSFPVFTLSVCVDDDIETIIGDDWGLSAEWEIISSDNAPIKMGFHYELLPNGNAQFVEECTYGKQEETASGSIRQKSPVKSESSENISSEFAKYSTYELPIDLCIDSPFEDSGDYYTVTGNLRIDYTIPYNDFDKLNDGDNFIIQDKQFVKGEMFQTEDYPRPIYSIYCMDDDCTYYICSGAASEFGSRFGHYYYYLLRSVPEYDFILESMEVVSNDFGEEEFKIAKDAYITSLTDLDHAAAADPEFASEEEMRMWYEQERIKSLEEYAHRAEDCYNNHISIGRFDGYDLPVLSSEYGELDQISCYVTFDDNGMIDSIIIRDIG